MTAVPYYSMIERFLTGVFCTLFFLLALLYLYTARKKENESQRTILYGIGFLFLFGFFLNYLFYTLAQSLDPGYYIGHIFYHEPRGNFDYEWYTRVGITNLQDVYLALNNNFSMLGYGIFIFCVEKVQKFKFHLISLPYFIFIPLYFVLPYDTWGYYTMFAIPLGYLIILLVILKIPNTSDESDKTLALYLFIGANSFVLGYLLISPSIKILAIFPIELGPIIYIFSATVWILPIINPDLLKTRIKLQKSIPVIVLTIIIMISLYSLPLAINTPNSLAIIIGFLFMAIISLIFYILLLKNLTQKPYKTKSRKHEELYSIFSKPEKLTEEEVSVSKEKKTCLVCKSKISGMTFVCLECATFYYEKCFTALSGLENACWACDSALDQTKPVRLVKKEEKEIEIEADTHKNLKK